MEYATTWSTANTRLSLPKLGAGPPFRFLYDDGFPIWRTFGRVVRPALRSPRSTPTPSRSIRRPSRCEAKRSWSRDGLRLRGASPAVDRGVAGGGYSEDFDRVSMHVDGDGDGVARVDVGAFERR